MLDAASAWSALSGWATPTPTILFLLLNLVIGFLFLIASRKNKSSSDDPPQHQYYDHHHHQIHHESHRPLLRAPSLFSRVTSLDFSHNPSDEPDHYAVNHEAAPPPLARAPSFLSRMTSFSHFYHHDHHQQAAAESESRYYSPPGESEKKSDESVPVTRIPSFLSRVTSFSHFYHHDDDQHHHQASAESETRVYSPPTDELERKSDDSVPVSGAPSSFRRSTEAKPEESKRSGPIERAPSLLARMASFNFSLRSTEAEAEAEKEAAREEHVTRSATVPKRKKKAVAPKMKKSSSDKSSETASFGGRHDEGVDAKADDFINKFKQQLRLQRLDSLLRYRSSAGES